MNIRAGILAVAICLIIFAVQNQPRPVKDNQAAYCVVSVYQGGKDREGAWHFFWGPMYRPCSEQDIYRNI